jgi:hypothetical protein
MRWDRKQTALRNYLDKGDMPAPMCPPGGRCWTNPSIWVCEACWREFDDHVKNGGLNEFIEEIQEGKQVK